MPVPSHPKLFHIVHVDRLRSIVESGGLYCDAHVVSNTLPGTTIGMSAIKERRLRSTIPCYPDLHVGDCVPFYFCPRSVMLYLIYKGNHPDLSYRGGQESIVHLGANLQDVVTWAESEQKRWSFTTSNAGSNFFESYNSLEKLDKINWNAVWAEQWNEPDIKEGKQAEFLLEAFCPWELIKRIAVYSESLRSQVEEILASTAHKPSIEVSPGFYY